MTSVGKDRGRVAVRILVRCLRLSPGNLVWWVQGPFTGHQIHPLHPVLLPQCPSASHTVVLQIALRFPGTMF